jgi:hypothetical protein
VSRTARTMPLTAVAPAARRPPPRRVRRGLRLDRALRRRERLHDLVQRRRARNSRSLLPPRRTYGEQPPATRAAFL